MPYPVTFLSLGPGDPELLTLQAVRLLREADVVMVPRTGDRSRAADIIGDCCAADKVHSYQLPMRREREDARAVYDLMGHDAAEQYRQGRHVVVAVEGDVGVYASIHYVLERLQEEDIPVQQVPGIPSFIAAAASAGLSLISQNERLVVLPGDVDIEVLRRLLTGRHVVVVMKVSQCQQVLKDYLLQYPDTVCHYFENVGTAEAFHTTDHATIVGREMPYFSLSILYPA